MIYPISEFFSIESAFDLVLLDETADSREDIDISIRLGNPEPGADAQLVESRGDEFFQDDTQRSIIDSRGPDQRCELRATGDSIEVTVTEAYRQQFTKRLSPSESAAFTELLVSTIEYRLLAADATIVYAAAVRSPDGEGVLIFGPGDSGKSTTVYRLTQEYDYEVLADDLVIFQGGRVYPFPRYVDLPLDVPEVRDAVERFRDNSGVQMWESVVSIPRRHLRSTTSPIEPAYCFFIRPREAAMQECSPLSSAEAKAMAVIRNESYSQEWTVSEPVRRFFGRYSVYTFQDNRDSMIRHALEGSSCFLVTSSDPTMLCDTIANQI